MEGEAKIYVPEESLFRRSEVFYNPVKSYGRDITVGLLNVYQDLYKMNINACDSMAASGVMGIRIMKEVDNVERVVFNDINPKACKLIKKNLKLNDINNKFEVHNKDANILFLEKRSEFNFIDIDPFGSPARYLSNVYAALKKKRSLLGVTSTDTAALYGRYPETCKRRYGVGNMITDFSKELGVRILITYIMRELAKMDMCFTPIYCHANHYFRVIGIVEKGVKKTNESLSKIKHISYCTKCLNRVIGFTGKCSNCGAQMNIIGPVYLGKIHDKEIITLLVDYMRGKRINLSELILMSNEIEYPLYYDIHELSKVLKKSPPPMKRIIEALLSSGFYASPTHLSHFGIKTNADIRSVINAFEESLQHRF